MMPTSRCCPVCHTAAEMATVFAEESIDSSRLSGFSYASRKEPEYMSHRLVRCPVCALVYVCNPPEQVELTQAYHTAEYDSSDEADDAAQSYIRAIAPILAKLPTKQRVLEIGSGTGIFLELLKNQGFSELIGIEPSAAAIAAAPAHRREWLRQGIFEESAFAPASFDLICCFMTLEHVRDPMQIALSARQLLRPQGVFVTVTHDYSSFVNRCLGKKSPIIDIEHMQLFSQSSVSELFQRAGFEHISTAPFSNRYSLNYWLRLAPLPKRIKSALKWLNFHTGMGQLKIAVNVGNTLTAGFQTDAN